MRQESHAEELPGVVRDARRGDARMLQKFPALKEPLRAYAAAPAVSASVPRAIKDALAA